jgi:hypothetical protein
MTRHYREWAGTRGNFAAFWVRLAVLPRLAEIPTSGFSVEEPRLGYRETLSVANNSSMEFLSGP